MLFSSLRILVYLHLFDSDTVLFFGLGARNRGTGACSARHLVSNFSWGPFY